MSADVPCAACGEALPPRARFCPECGAPVAAAPRPTGPGERRRVAVLFADLAGYTRMTASLDPEDVHQLLGRYFEAVDGVVRDHGGHVDKHIGDAVMGVFGAPVAHGDDAERAARAACAIHAALERISESLGRPLRAHVGVALGEVVAADTGSSTHREYTVTGDAVNLASRLDGLARGGETLVSDELLRAVRGRVDAEALGPVSIKGLAAPVEVWRLRGVRDVDEGERPLVGREAERARFAGLLDGLDADGLGAVMIVRGEAGIGKTRLLAELLRAAAARGVSCHRALVLDFGVARGAGAVAALAASLLGARADDGEAERSAALARAIGEGWVEGADLPFTRDLLDLPQPDEARRVLEAMDPAMRERARGAALARLLRAGCRHAPRLLAVEDLHWADADTLACLAAVARATAEAPAVLLATTRPAGDPLGEPWRAAVAPARWEAVDLAPLGEADADALADAFDVPDAATREACVARAGGNALFLVQLLRGAREGGELPATVHTVVQARIDRLAPGDKAAVQAASVIGQRFPLALLRALLGDAAFSPRGLVAHDLVRPDGDAWLFAHALVREGAYASLLHRRRRELHAAAAEWYRERDARLHAEHLERAGDPRADDAYVAAARALVADFRYDAALPLAERARALATSGAARHAAAMTRGECLRELGRNREALDAFREAAAEPGDPPARFAARWEVAATHRLLSEPDEGLAALAEAEPLAEGLGDVARGSVHYLRGNLHFARGDVEACAASHQHALELARAAGDAAGEARAWSGMGDVAYARGRMRSSGEAFRRCVAACDAAGLLRFSVTNRAMAAWSRFWCGDARGAVLAMRDASALAHRLGHVNAEVMTEESLGVALLWTGALAEAEAVNTRALELALGAGARRYAIIVALQLSELALVRGDLDGARARAEWALRDVEAIGARKFAGAIAYAALARASRDPAERARWLAAGEAELARGAVSHAHLWFYAVAMRARLDDRRWDDVDRYADALEAYTREEPLAWSGHHAALGRALARAGRGARDAYVVAELRRLRAEADTFGYGLGAPLLDEALAAGG
ncbi:MAG: adenylate/guanylate cyclase domain-containing protein [Myxococcota bacterium]